MVLKLKADAVGLYLQTLLLHREVAMKMMRQAVSKGMSKKVAWYSLMLIVMVSFIICSYCSLSFKPNPFIVSGHKDKAIYLANIIGNELGIGVYGNMDSLVDCLNKKYNLADIIDDLCLASITVDSQYAEMKTVRSGNFFHERQYSMRVEKRTSVGRPSSGSRNTNLFNRADSLIITEFKYGINDY